MGRSGVLPTALGKVNPKRKTPDNAIHLEVGMQVVAFVCILIFGVTNVFLTWANAITIGLVLMYILANIGVVKYYLTEGRSQFNPLLHLIIPAVASAAGVVVVWKSYFSPFTSSGPVYWGLLVFITVLVLTIVTLIYLSVRGQEDWMRKAQLVYEQSGEATRTGLRMADTPHGGRATPADGRLRGRVGLITGAASGIGAAGAELFAAQGAALVLVDLDAAQGERVAASGRAAALAAGAAVRYSSRKA
jgi:hypothetical protein